MPAPARTTTTLAAPPSPPRATFPGVVDAAMKTFKAEPGLEAPVIIPSAPAAVSAQTTDLGGSDSVTLIATPHPLPVNDPSLSYHPSTNLGTFTSTVTATDEAAARFLATAEASTLATCSGSSSLADVDGVPAESCPTAEGEAITWSIGAWKMQVLALGGSAPPASQAAEVESWIVAHPLPAASAGLLSAVTPGASSLVWEQGPAVYQTRSQQSLTAAASLAASMRPWAP
jgi:hypothetical protein